MIHLILGYLWGSAMAQFGLAGIVLIGAVAAFLWLGDVPGVRHIAVAVASVCIVFLFLAPKLYIEGINYEKAKWDAAELAATKRGEEARAAAEREISEQPASESNAGRGIVHRIIHPRRVQHIDPNDRDHQ